MKCSACGEDNAKGARFCSFCGTRLSDEAADEAQHDAEQAVSSNTARPISDNPYQPRRMPKIHADASPAPHEPVKPKVFLFDDEKEEEQERQKAHAATQQEAQRRARLQKLADDDPFFDDEDDDDDDYYDDEDESSGRGGKIFIAVISVVTVLILVIGVVAFMFYTPSGSRLRAYYGMAASAEDYVYLADWQLQNGNESEAAASYYNAFLLKRDDFDFSLKIAQSFERCNAYERAEQMYMYLIDQYPLESDPYDYLMALLVREGQQEAYAALLDYRTEHQPGYVAPEPSPQAVAAPSISPEGGNYTGSVHISMKAEEGASIYFTIDGTQPTKASRLYTGPVILYSGTYTLRAAAFSGSAASDVVEVVYVIS